MNREAQRGHFCIENKSFSIDILLTNTHEALKGLENGGGIARVNNNCVGKGKSLPEQCTMHKVEKIKKRTGQEMRLTTQIREF